MEQQLPPFPQSLSEVPTYVQKRWQAALRTAGELRNKNNRDAVYPAGKRVGVDPEFVLAGAYLYFLQIPAQRHGH